MKYFVLSDVHNKYDLMIKALKDNAYDKDNPNHKIIFLGDAFDKGDEPVETYLFFRDLVLKDKMVWILGNHDDELISCLKDSSRKCKDTQRAIARYYDNSIDDNTDTLTINDCLIKNGVLDILTNYTCNYYEIPGYIFTHGCIPTIKGKYDPNWRNTPNDRWKGRTTNGVKRILKEGLEIPGSVLVCGHVGAYFGHLITRYPNVDIKGKEFDNLKKEFIKNKENYKTFISDRVINLDANGYKNGFINVLVIDED